MNEHDIIPPGVGLVSGTKSGEVEIAIRWNRKPRASRSDVVLAIKLLRALVVNLERAAD